MRLLLAVCLFLLESSVLAGAITWGPVGVVNGGVYGVDELRTYDLWGRLNEGPYDIIARAEGPMMSYWHDGEMFLRQKDHNTTSMPVGNQRWMLAYLGELLTVDSFSVDRLIPLSGWDDLSTTGGVVVDTPSDFYIAFDLEALHPETGDPLLGWMHVSVDYDDDRMMTLLDSGVGVSGSMYVGGAIPEPSSGVLLLMGLGLLGLRRRRV